MELYLYSVVRPFSVVSNDAQTAALSQVDVNETELRVNETELRVVNILDNGVMQK